MRTLLFVLFIHSFYTFRKLIKIGITLGITIKALSIHPLLRRLFYRNANEMNFNVVERVHCDGQRYISFDDLHVQRDLRRDRIGSRCRADGVADRGGNTPARRGERIYLTGRPIYA